MIIEHLNIHSEGVVKTKETPKVIISLLKEAIICVRIKEDVYIDEKDMDLHYEIFKEFSKGMPMPFLIVFGKGSNFKREVNDQFLEERRKKLKSMEAIVLETLPHRILLNFYIKFFKPKHPTRIFSREIDALKWISKERIQP